MLLPIFYFIPIGCSYNNVQIDNPIFVVEQFSFLFLIKELLQIYAFSKKWFSVTIKNLSKVSVFILYRQKLQAADWLLPSMNTQKKINSSQNNVKYYKIYIQNLALIFNRAW